MVTCQSSELGWEVTLELPADFLSLGRGSVKLVSKQHLARDPFDHQQPQEVVNLQDHLFHCALHVRGGISESAG